MPSSSFMLLEGLALRFVTVLQSFMAMPDGELSADSILQVMIGIAGVPIADVFAKMSNEDVNYIVKACLSVCRRLHSGGQSPVMPNGTMMFSDIEIDSMLGLVYAVTTGEPRAFFSYEPVSTGHLEIAGFNPLSMSSGEDWLMRPVLEGMCRYESLKDGSIDLLDLAKMNESLNVKSENERRAQAAISAARV